MGIVLLLTLKQINLNIYSVSSIDICKKVKNQTYLPFKKKKVEIEKVEDVSSDESEVDPYTELLSTINQDHSSEGKINISC